MKFSDGSASEMFGLGGRLLLYIDSVGATLAVWQGGRSRATHEFADNPAGYLACSHLARRYAHLPVHITVETFEEDYRAHIMPRASGRDREQMLQRKLGLLYHGSRFRGVCRQGSRLAGKHERRYLFAALTNERPLQPWVDALVAAECSIAGVHPLALVLQGLGACSGAVDRKQILIVRHRNAVRHMFLDADGLRLNRLTRLSPPAAQPDALADEIRHTRSYLEDAKLLRVDEQIGCAVLDAPDWLDALRHAHPRLSVMKLDMTKLTKALRAPLPDARFVALGLMGRRPPCLNLADSSLTAGHRFRRRRLRMHLATAVLAIATAIGSFTAMRAVRSLEVEQARLAHQFAIEDQRVRQRVESKPREGNSAELEKLVEAAEGLQRASRSPHLAYRIASRVMDRHPEFVLQRIDWRSTHLGPRTTASPGTLESIELHLSLPDAPAIGMGRRDTINTLLADLENQDSVSRVTLRRSSARGVDMPDAGMGADSIAPTFQVLVHLASGV
jgi:hypothetical protein